MERTKKQKEQLLKDLWYSRNPCHDNDQEGNDRFWGTALCVFADYQKALTTLVATTRTFRFSGGSERVQFIIDVTAEDKESATDYFEASHPYMFWVNVTEI